MEGRSVPSVQDVTGSRRRRLGDSRPSPLYRWHSHPQRDRYSGSSEPRHRAAAGSSSERARQHACDRIDQAVAVSSVERQELACFHVGRYCGFRDERPG